jgi:hypothetical protein
MVACGADHCLSIGASGVWGWGSNSGYKLGLGDQKDRYDPVLLPRFKEKIILQVAAGAWHSMAIVQYPPMFGGGVVCILFLIFYILLLTSSVTFMTSVSVCTAVLMGERISRTARSGINPSLANCSTHRLLLQVSVSLFIEYLSPSPSHVVNILSYLPCLLPPLLFLILVFIFSLNKLLVEISIVQQ